MKHRLRIVLGEYVFFQFRISYLKRLIFAQFWRVFEKSRNMEQNFEIYDKIKNFSVFLFQQNV